MAEKIPENVVLCVDASRSMYRSDYKPNRLMASINALKKLAELRLEQDPNSAFAIIKFSDTIEKILDFSGSVDSIHASLSSIRFGGNSALVDALGLSIKVIIAELRKVGAKIPKILLCLSQRDGVPQKLCEKALGQPGERIQICQKKCHERAPQDKRRISGGKIWMVNRLSGSGRK